MTVPSSHCVQSSVGAGPAECRCGCRRAPGAVLRALGPQGCTISLHWGPSAFAVCSLSSISCTCFDCWVQQHSACPSTSKPLLTPTWGRTGGCRASQWEMESQASVEPWVSCRRLYFPGISHVTFPSEKPCPRRLSCSRIHSSVCSLSLPPSTK